eukprot:4467602-Prymnesium_polylepis.3
MRLSACGDSCAGEAAEVVLYRLLAEQGQGMDDASATYASGAQRSPFAGLRHRVVIFSLGAHWCSSEWEAQMPRRANSSWPATSRILLRPRKLLT